MRNRIAVFIISILLISCTKSRIPDNIPTWLSDELERLEKCNRKKRCCDPEACVAVYEYMGTGGEKYYRYDRGGFLAIVYDAQGNILCVYPNGGCTEEDRQVIRSTPHELIYKELL